MSSTATKPDVSPIKALWLALQTRLAPYKQGEVGPLILTQRRVYTVPSKSGWFFLLCLVLFFITATHYSLSLGLSLTYFLSACVLVNAFLSFRNLAYLRLQAGQCESVFAGEVVQCPILIDNPSKLDRFALHIGWAKQKKISETFDLEAHNQVSINLHFPSQQRGLLSLPRIRIYTHFPMGLMYVWSLWQPQVQALIYPSPESNPPAFPNAGGDESAQTKIALEGDYHGVRQYQVGDPIKHLSWKHIARLDLESGGNLISKEFAHQGQNQLCFDFNQLSTQLDVELRLSRLCAWIVQAQREQRAYSLRIGTEFFAMASTEEHQRECLRALALYPAENHRDTHVKVS
jgi:uncharacterized protein (DUF58 family)